MLWIGLLAGTAAYGLFALSRCFFRVDEGNLAVLTTFGAAERAADGRRLRTWGPGLHRKLPWQRAVVVPVMEQSLDLSGEDGGRTAMAEDGTLLRFDSILRYVPDEAELARFLFGLRNPKEHMMGLFTCLLRNEIANFRAPRPSLAPAEGRFDFALHAGSYALIRRERALLNQRIEELCRDQIGARYGVRFNAVDLTDILPPDEIADSLNAVIHARTSVETRYFRAEGDCQQRTLSAEAGVAIARARAHAVETEMTGHATFLAALHRDGTLPLYVARRRSEVLSESRVLYVKEVA